MTKQLTALEQLISWFLENTDEDHIKVRNSVRDGNVLVYVPSPLVYPFRQKFGGSQLSYNKPFEGCFTYTGFRPYEAPFEFYRELRGELEARELLTNINSVSMRNPDRIWIRD